MTSPDSPDIAPPSQRVAGFVLRAALVGLVIGVLTIGLQKILPYPVSQVANSGVVWVIAAFVFGRFAHKWSIAVSAGIVALVGEVLGYYAVAYLLHLFDLTISSLAIIGVWIVLALIAGSLFGLAGYAAHRTGIAQKLGQAALGAAFVGEGLYFMISLSLVSVGVGWFVIASVITFVLTRKAPQPLQIWFIAIGLGVIAFGGEQVLVLLDGLRAANF